MIVLCSNGLTSEALIEELQKHISECRNAAIVVTADNLYKEKNYHVPSCVHPDKGVVSNVFRLRQPL